MLLRSLPLIALVTGCMVGDTAAPGEPDDSAGSGSDTGSASGSDGSDMSEHALSNSEQSAFNFFVSKGLTATESAAIVGNLIQESSVDPTSVEFGGGPGRGIAQWSVGGRWDTSSHDNMTWYASTNGLTRSSLSAQLAFIWYELQTYSTYGLASLKSATSLTAAVVAFQDKFEICGACNQSRRISSAQQVLTAYGSGGTTGGGGANSGASCYSGTLGKEMPDNACVQSKFDNDWYQCASGSWVDRWSDPDACNGVHPL